MAGDTHYHSPACRDIKREMTRYGQSESDTFPLTISSVADIIDFEDGGRASDCNEEYSPEWWMEATENARHEVKLMSCVRDSIPAGKTTQGAIILVKGGYIQGVEEIKVEDAPKSRQERMTDAAKEKMPEGTQVRVRETAVFRVGAYSGRVVAHGARPFFSGEEITWYIPTVTVEGGNGAQRTLMVGDLEEITEQTWTTHRHTVSKGDKVTADGVRGTVYALIPGLPVVYVDFGKGEMPSPVPASKVHAL
jgi:hypothetical protein